MITVPDLEDLYMRKNQIDLELTNIHKERSDLSKRNSRADKIANEINKEIKELINSAKDPKISEHAVMRYIERVLKGREALKLMRQEILPDEYKDEVRATNGGITKIQIGNTHVLSVKNGVVVTVTPPKKYIDDIQ